LLAQLVRKPSQPGWEPTEMMQKAIARGVGRATEYVLQRGSGSWVETACGRRLLDFTCGIGVTNTGHCHPRVVAAAQRQCESIVHAMVGVGYHEPMLELIETLHPLMPHESLDSFFFCTTGAEAVENAVKLSKVATGRSNIIVFQGGYHGRTSLTMGMTTSSTIYKTGFGPFAPGVHVAPFPYELHGVSVEYCTQQLEQLLRQQVAPSEVAAMVIEPVLGEGGYVPAPNSFLVALRRVCDAHGILLVADEVQTGFGRTGKLFAVEHHAVRPDVLVMAKGLASGFPLAGIASRRELTDTQAPGSMGGTYAGNAVSCAAAVATQKVIQEEGLVGNAQQMGTRLSGALAEVAARHGDVVRDVRGLGSMVGVELDQRFPAATAKAVTQACARKGLLLLPTSIFPTIRFIPPLNASAAEVDQAVSVFDAALEEVCGEAAEAAEAVEAAN